METVIARLQDWLGKAKEKDRERCSMKKDLETQ